MIHGAVAGLGLGLGVDPVGGYFDDYVFVPEGRRGGELKGVGGRGRWVWG